MFLKLLLVISLGFAAGKTVETQLKASWSSTELIYEVLEHVNAVYPDHYSEALDWLVETNSLQKPIQTQDDYDHLLDSVSDHFAMDASSKGLFHLAMAIRQYAPMIQAHIHYYKEYVQSGRTLKDCPIWVDVQGQQICDPNFVGSVQQGNSLYTALPFDRVMSSLDSNAMHLVMYADLTHADFPSFHKAMRSVSKEKRVNYVLRYKPKQTESSHIFLSGYGVELAVKSTEYKVTDDRNVNQEGATKSSSSNTNSDAASDDVFNQGEPVVVELKSEEMNELGMKTARYIFNSADPLQSLVQVSQNFPKYAHIIARMNMTAKDSRKDEIQSGIDKTFLTFNGISIDAEQLNIFEVVRKMLLEDKSFTALLNLGYSTEQASLLLSKYSSNIKSKSSGDEEQASVFDVRFDKMVWFNDLAKDARYERFPPSVQSLLRPMYPGQLAPTRFNLFQVVYVLDLSKFEQTKAALEVLLLVEKGIPLRFAIAPLTLSTDVQHDIRALSAFCYLYMHKKSGVQGVQSLLNELSDIEENATMLILHRVFKDLTGQSVEDALKDDIGVKVTIDLPEWVSYNQKVGSIFTPQGFLFLNGQFIEMSPSYQAELVKAYHAQLYPWQQKAYQGEIDQNTDFEAVLFDQSHVLGRRNAYLSDEEKYPLQVVRLSTLSNDLPYLLQSPERANVTLVLVDNFDTDSGIEAARSLISFALGDEAVRVSFVHAAEQGCVVPDWSLSLVARHLARISSREFLEKLLAWITSLANTEELDEMKTALVSDGYHHEELASKSFESCQYLKNLLPFNEPLSFVIANNKVIGPFSKGYALNTEDYAYLARDERQKLSLFSSAMQAAYSSNKPDRSYADFVLESAYALHSSSAVLKASSPWSRALPTRIQLSEMVMNMRNFTVGDETTAKYKWECLMDPLSSDGQKLGHFLSQMSQLPGTFVRVLLSPAVNLQKTPLNRFYRFSLPLKLKINPQDGSVTPHTVVFNRLPKDALLTQGMDVPNAWIVTPIQSPHDLDNIKLDQVDSVHSVFELKSILVEGHAKDENGKPPRGVQFTLGTREHPELTDTITMSNFGYLQLKANPGVWQFKLRKGPSHDVYALQGVDENGDSLPEETAEIHVTSFEGLTMFPQVKKRSGMEDQDVLSEEAPDQQPSFFESMKSKFFGNGSDSKRTIHVFSVASGHLYERFLSIMTLSVVQNTKNPVKFWFIENFLSPSFKDFLPHLAEEVGFEYELVTYKWPHWLRKQTEKQRTIWGYKILFLDVLFPLSLDKVIFVDADQVVRTDLLELVEMDLNGAVYGYTPFCDNRPEMDKFRFWKSGYWADHLRGRPYHISALYVVDLVRFRQLAAGDRLRGEYHMLSADPNSLANLDQDLPNNMMHQIPMFSLPREWLWCETWCSDASLSKAKTIDLCNNPLTKEPKLERARRILPEWDGLDKQVAAIAEKAKQKVQSQGSSSDRHDEL